MSTHSVIARETPNGIEAIFCQYDGYPEHHLPILTGHYATDEAVEALMKLGDLSVLGEEIGEKHSFAAHGKDPRTRDWCLSYWRDGGEQDAGPTTYDGEDKFLADARENGADYLYIFRAGRWLYQNARCSEEWREAKA